MEKVERDQLFSRWRNQSQQKLVCGMFGCPEIPCVPCTWGCSNHYCQEHSEEHWHSGAELRRAPLLQDARTYFDSEGCFD